MSARLFLFVLITCFFLNVDGQRKQIPEFLQVLDTAKSDQVRMKYLRNAGYAYVAVNVDSSLLYGEQLVSLAKAYKHDNYLADGYNMIGIYYAYGDKYDSAIFYFEKILDVLNNDMSNSIVSMAVTNIGVTYNKIGRHDLSVKLLMEKLPYVEISEETESSDLRQLGFMQLALVSNLIHLDFLEDALDQTMKSIQQTSAINDSTLLAYQYVCLSDIYNGLERPEKTIECAEKGISFAKGIGHDRFLTMLYLALGYAYLQLEHYDIAISYVKSAVRISKKIPSGELKSRGYSKFGEIYLALNQLDTGLYYSKKSFRLAIESSTPMSSTVAYFNMAEYYRNIQSLDSSLSHGLKSYEIAHEHGYYAYMVKAAYLVYEVYRELGFSQKALEYHEKYATGRDTLDRRENALAIAKSEMEFINQARLDSINFALAEQDKINELREKQRNQRTYGLIMVLFFSLAGVLVLLILLRNNRRKRRALQAMSDELQHTNKEIELKHKQLKAAQQKLIVQEKMASLGVMAAGIGHEINNPLNFIRQGVRVISKKSNKSEDREFEAIQEGVSRIHKITSALGRFSRELNEPDVTCNIHEILEECSQPEMLKAKDGVVFKKDFSARQYSILGTKSALQQIFANIIRNSLDATARGTIEICTRNEGKMLIVTITDTGKGISEENLLKVRDPFFTTKEPNEGMGLGLYLVSENVSKHGGHCEMESELGKGTRVMITFPLHS